MSRRVKIQTPAWWLTNTNKELSKYNWSVPADALNDKHAVFVATIEDETEKAYKLTLQATDKNGEVKNPSRWIAKSLITKLKELDPVEDDTEELPFD